MKKGNPRAQLPHLQTFERWRHWPFQILYTWVYNLHKRKIEFDYVSLPQKAVGIMSISPSSPSRVGSDTTNSFSPTTSTTSSTPSSYNKDSTPQPWIIYHLIEKTMPCELPLRTIFSFNTSMLDETNQASSSRRLHNRSLIYTCRSEDPNTQRPQQLLELWPQRKAYQWVLLISRSDYAFNGWCCNREATNPNRRSTRAKCQSRQRTRGPVYGPWKWCVACWRVC